MYPKCHRPKDKNDKKLNCGTCICFDWLVEQCGDKEARKRNAAKIYAEWDKSHRKWERMMQGNRGVWLE